MINNIQILDNIVLSNKVVDDFYTKYNTDAEFKAWLDCTIPQIAKCEAQQQNNPWHKYNVLGHILHSVEEMNQQTATLPNDTRRMLAYVMLFHDIGKPDCHIVREKNGQMIDSFFNHNVRSCEIAKEILPKLNFTAKEVKVMAKLVYKHDIFMFIKECKTNNPHWRVLTNELIQEEINDLNKVGEGKTLLKYLIMVGRSDNLAQNERMTGESLKMLAKFDRMLQGYKSTYTK